MRGHAQRERRRERDGRAGAARRVDDAVGRRDHLEAAAERLTPKGVKFAKFRADRDEKEWAKENLSLNSFPTLLLFPKGRSGYVKLGSEHPIVRQTMATTLTSDVDATVEQVVRCADEGFDLVRITVVGMKEALACHEIREGLFQKGYDIPLCADMHFQPAVAIKTAEAVDRAGRKVGVMKTFDDGSKVQENLNGTVIEIALDGTRTQTNKDGTVITSYLDGSKRQQNRDGKVIETTVDGEQVQTNPDGTRIVLNSKDSGCGCLGL